MITLNNRKADWREGLTIQTIMEERKYTFPKIQVYINDQLIEASNYKTAAIHDGDDVKILHLLAGGWKTKFNQKKRVKKPK